MIAGFFRRGGRGPIPNAAGLVFVVATVVVCVSLFLPWSSEEEFFFGDTYERVVTGFSGWGWLSAAACLIAISVALVVAGQLFGHSVLGMRVSSRVLGVAAIGAGAVELAGNIMVLSVKPESISAYSYALVPQGHGLGLLLATGAGGLMIASGLLLLAPASG